MVASFLKYSGKITVAVGLCLACASLPLRAAEDVDSSGQSYVVLNADARSYEIINKENKEERLSYYKSIREKIAAKLKKNYTGGYNDGDIHLFFVLDRKGAIARIDVALNRSTKDTKLIDTALKSLQQAAPFGPFPKGISEDQIPFSLIVTFKKDNK